MSTVRQPSGGRPHIAHIIGALQTGGAEKQLVNYLAAADRTTFRHSVVCLTRAGDLAGDVEKVGLPVHVIRVRLRSFPWDLLRLAVWLKGAGVTLVHTHMFYSSLWGRLAGLLAGVPLFVTTEHGKEPWKRQWHIRLDRWLGARTFRQIAVSRDVRTIRMERDGAPAARIVLIPNGVPIPPRDIDPGIAVRVRREFGLDPDQPVIGTVGRVVPAKAYPVLLEAIASLQDRLPRLHWLQIGDGPERAALEAMIGDRGLAGMVTCAGQRSDIGDLLQAMDIWVMSSIREGLPVALLEAMAAERTIVATAVGGIPDAVEDGQSARLVPPDDPRALAAGIVEILEDRELATRLAAGARRRAESEFSIAAVAGRIEDIYRQALAAGGIPFNP